MKRGREKPRGIPERTARQLAREEASRQRARDLLAGRVPNPDELLRRRAARDLR